MYDRTACGHRTTQRQSKQMQLRRSQANAWDTLESATVIPIYKSWATPHRLALHTVHAVTWTTTTAEIVTRASAHVEAVGSPSSVFVGRWLLTVACWFITRTCVSGVLLLLRFAFQTSTHRNTHEHTHMNIGTFIHRFLEDLSAAFGQCFNFYYHMHDYYISV